MKAFTYL